MTWLQQNVDLKAYNSLGFAVRARYFCQLQTHRDVQRARHFCRHRKLPWLVLGGGSNVVLTDDFAGLVMQMQMQQINWSSTLPCPPNAQLIRVEAGYSWDKLVSESLARGLYGLENLSLIPGQVGAAPIQNIGAYGVEVKDLITQVEGYDMATGQCFSLSAEQCHFGYRTSIFKAHTGRQWLITAVTFCLQQQPNITITYQGLAATVEQLTDQAAKFASPVQIRQAVIDLRRKKLPDPANIANVGSFFKNPVVNQHQLDRLLQRWSCLVYFPVSLGHYRLAAAWLIEQLGWKGMCRDGVGVHHNQALVLVHHGGGDGRALLALAQDIQRDVKCIFGIGLEVEPCLLGNQGQLQLSQCVTSTAHQACTDS